MLHPKLRGPLREVLGDEVKIRQCRLRMLPNTVYTLMLLILRMSSSARRHKITLLVEGVR